MSETAKRKRANLRDVARTAGVSVATVSRVLNAPDVVSPNTRGRVEDAIKELNFHPSAAARAINSGRTKIIGALIPTLNNDIFALTIDSIESRLGQFGFSLVVATTSEDPGIEARRAKELLDVGVEGLFLSGVAHSDTLHDLLERTQVPTAAVSYFDPTYRFPTFGYDNRAAAQLAMSHVRELGHRKIAVVHGPVQHNDRTRERLAGLTEDPFDGQLTYFETSIEVSGGATAVRRALERKQHFDAYLCTSDVQAFGVMSELQRHGLNVPEDVSVMGIHDLPQASWTYPRLSTVSLPAREMGQTAAEKLAEWIETGIRPESHRFPLALKVRDSTARAR